MSFSSVEARVFDPIVFTDPSCQLSDKMDRHVRYCVYLVPLAFNAVIAL